MAEVFEAVRTNPEAWEAMQQALAGADLSTVDLEPALVVALPIYERYAKP
jgi:hypothetical protein